jgi:hypothetical protein
MNTGAQDEEAMDEHSVSKGVWQRKGRVLLSFPNDSIGNPEQSFALV